LRGSPADTDVSGTGHGRKRRSRDQPLNSFLRPLPPVATPDVAAITNNGVRQQMLALEPNQLAVTDIADHALSVMAKHSIEEVVLLGRREHRTEGCAPSSSRATETNPRTTSRKFAAKPGILETFDGRRAREQCGVMRTGRRLGPHPRARRDERSLNLGPGAITRGRRCRSSLE
jgi:hypothetical protein